MTESIEVCIFVVVKLILTNISVGTVRGTKLWLVPLLSCSGISPVWSGLAPDPEVPKPDAH